MEPSSQLCGIDYLRCEPLCSLPPAECRGGSPYSPLAASSGPQFPHLQSDRLRSVGGSVGRGSHGGGGASPPTLASLPELLSTGD